MNPNYQSLTAPPDIHGIVLLADNDSDFLATRAEFLESAGYRVITATTLTAAEKVLNETRIHLAVLDIRLVDDDDEKDASGLALAQIETYRSIPKIILTGFPSVSAVRSAFKPRNVPPAIEFLAKQDGPDALIEAVKEAFAQHVRINWNLDIQTNERNPLTFVHLASLVGAYSQDERLLERADELKDLFQRLFYDRNRIRIDRLLWHRKGRVALTVFAVKQGASPESFVVVCGLSSQIADEVRRYQEYAPKAASSTETSLVGSAETTHFAANAYALARADLENMQSLAERFRSGPENLFNLTLNTLFEKTLAMWHEGKRILEEVKALDEVYREQLGLAEERVSRDALDVRLSALVRQAPILGAKVERTERTLALQFERRAFTYPDPMRVFYQLSDLERPATLINAPGILSGDNVLTEAKGNSWLTDFANAGRAPLFWNFVALEAAIRFDWPEERNLQWLHGMEECLTTGEFSKLNLGDVEPPLRKLVRAIQVIRKAASRTVGQDERLYHAGILFQAASRLATFDPAVPLMPSEVARLMHVLIAAAMICARLARLNPTTIIDPLPAAKGLRLDMENHVVLVENAAISLRGQGYDLLCYLYAHANKLCTRRELVERCLEEKFDDHDDQQISRLNTAIGRLRAKIEPDSDRPIYLVTEAGAGYRLILDPPI